MVISTGTGRANIETFLGRGSKIVVFFNCSLRHLDSELQIKKLLYHIQNLYPKNYRAIFISDIGNCKDINLAFISPAQKILKAVYILINVD